MRSEKKILLSASLFHALNDAATVAVPMIFPLLYSQQFIILKYSHIGILSHFGLLVTFIFQILVVHLSLRFEYKLMLFLSFSGICLSLGFLTLSSSLFSLLVFYLVFRAFDSFYHTIGIAWVTKTRPAQGMDFAMGIQSGSGNLGVFAAFISVGYLAERYNWKMPLLCWAGASGILGLISYFSVRNVSSKERDLPALNLSSWMATLKAIKNYLPGFFFGGACWGTTVYFAPSLLHHRFDIPLGQTGLYLAFWIGIGTVTTYTFGFISRFIGREKIFLIGLLGATLSLFFLGMADRAVMAKAGLLVFGAFLFFIYPALQSNVGCGVSARNQTQAFSLVSNIQMLSGAIVALISGFISDKYGIHAPFLLMGILGICVSAYSVISFQRKPA